MQRYSSQVAWSEEDQAFIATSLEFPYLSGVGDTDQEALEQLRAAIEAAVDAIIEDGEKVPEPLFIPDFSGQLRLRLPKSQHAELTKLAEREGMSLNSYIMHLVSVGQGKIQASAQLAGELAALRQQLRVRGVRSAFPVDDAATIRGDVAVGDLSVVSPVNTSH